MKIASVISPVHILFSFSTWSSEGGARVLALDLYNAFRQREIPVFLWTEREPDPLLLPSYPIRRIQPYRGDMPHGGTMIFVGMSMPPGAWYDSAAPQRVAIECTMFAPEKLYRLVHRLSLGGKVDVELAYCSGMIRDLCALPGVVHPNMSGLDDFLAVRRDKVERPFTIGRVSRDTVAKHHFRDIALYHKIAAMGWRVKVVGGTCLIPYLEQEIPGVELLPECPRSEVPRFLAGLDCFFYRTPLHCPEGWGMVVMEAMASGLPVVCGRHGGYAELIRQGENGHLFDTDTQALEILARLAGDVAYREACGRTASDSIRNPELPGGGPAVANWY